MVGKARGQQRHRNELQSTIKTPTPMPTPMMLLMGWLWSRRRRCVFLLFCYPLLLPILCLTFPFLCVAELCFGLCRRRSQKSPDIRVSDNAGAGRLLRCEEGDPIEVGEVRLLHRYLEDQIRLVGSVYDCGDDAIFCEDDYYGEKTPLLP
ncbi:hypothetical protein HHK36_009143 [Tetracentron sinense]|uniref:Uncharacterized protein n=1 Tax=Tetracentron sinense TaxID=13715 RepID=A0A834ZD04_TETSI|nr:hypothetical protein HHK36_009143 [Tetracentron sinense]